MVSVWEHNSRWENIIQFILGLDVMGSWMKVESCTISTTWAKYKATIFFLWQPPFKLLYIGNKLEQKQIYHQKTKRSRKFST